MLTVAQITEIERSYFEFGLPELGRARGALAERWHAGERDRETLLRIVFLEWYSCSEPEFLTGMSPTPFNDAMYDDVATALLEDWLDNEVAFVLNWMTKQFSWCCSNGWLNLWKAKSGVIPTPMIDPGIFAGRGSYGKYFAHIASME